MSEREFDRSAFGGRLKAAIARSGLNQSAVAAQVGQPRSRVSEWVRGQRVPGVRDVMAMAGVLGVSLDWLVAGQEPPAPERAVVDDLARLAPDLVPLVDRAKQLASG